MNKRKRGYKFETIAADYLVSLGYRIAAVNFHLGWGELDLVIYDAKRWIGVEVKSVSVAHSRMLYQLLRRKKILRLQRMLSAWQINYDKSQNSRSIQLDFIGITVLASGECKISHLTDIGLY